MTTPSKVTFIICMTICMKLFVRETKTKLWGKEMIRRVATRFGGSEVGHTFLAWNRIWKVRVPGMNAEAEIVQNEVD